ncbi:MAG TPA: helix-turn-helix transcriptional regulator [Streptosporangiaceae bacterium]
MHGSCDASSNLAGIKPAHDPLDEIDAHVARLRQVAQEMRARRQPPSGPVELIPDVGRLRLAYPQLQRDTRTSMRSLNRAPYYNDPAAQTELQSSLMRSGVRFDAIYGHDIIESEIFPHLRRWVAAGERARLVPEVPMKLSIFDDTCALIVVPEESEQRSHLIVHPSGLLDGIIAMFETIWRIATPVPSLAPVGTHGFDQDRDVLFLLAAGATDATIARHLGISERTAHRRVKALMESLGARTRFQAGIQAARRRLV